MKFTACYTKLEDGFGYMGQLLEWPNVVTSGKDLEDCEDMLKDAAQGMALCYRDDGMEIPKVELFVKPISIPLDDESLKNYEENAAALSTQSRETEALLEDVG